MTNDFFGFDNFWTIFGPFLSKFYYFFLALTIPRSRWPAPDLRPPSRLGSFCRSLRHYSSLRFANVQQEWSKVGRCRRTGKRTSIVFSMPKKSLPSTYLNVLRLESLHTAGHHVQLPVVGDVRVARLHRGPVAAKVPERVVEDALHGVREGRGPRREDLREPRVTTELELGRGGLNHKQ
jgi:hypothetical protein